MKLRDLSIPFFDRPGRVRIRYSVITDRRGNLRAYFYFVDRAYEALLEQELVRDQIERLCLLDDARRSEIA